MTAPLSVPLMLLIMLAVGLERATATTRTGSGPAAGAFRMVKFRTMRVDAERDTGPSVGRSQR